MLPSFCNVNSVNKMFKRTLPTLSNYFNILYHSFWGAFISVVSIFLIAYLNVKK